MEKLDKDVTLQTKKGSNYKDIKTNRDVDKMDKLDLVKET